MNESTLFSGILDSLKNHWKLLVATGIAAALAAMVFTMPAFMPPRFKSTAVVYPSNLYTLSDESETEQMLQLLADDDIQKVVTERFKLNERWGLNPGEPEYNYWIDLLYQERVTISPTRYESVEISCQDEDPEIAKQMAETILEIYNSELNKSILEKHIEYKTMSEREMKELKGIMDSLQSRLVSIRTESGILDFESQSERYSEGYMRMLEKGGSGKNMEKVQSLMKELADKGSEVEILQAMIQGIQEAYADLSKKVAIERSKTVTELTYYQYVVRPQTADKKEFPVRWLMLALSVILTVIAASVLLVGYDHWKSSKT